MGDGRQELRQPNWLWMACRQGRYTVFTPSVYILLSASLSISCEGLFCSCIEPASLPPTPVSFQTVWELEDVIQDHLPFKVRVLPTLFLMESSPLSLKSLISFRTANVQKFFSMLGRKSTPTLYCFPPVVWFASGKDSD